jgi:hypothetical protein
MEISSLPTIIRVRNKSEAEFESRLQGLSPSKVRYIHRTDQIRGITFQPEITYFINQDVPYYEIEMRKNYDSR